MEALGIYYRAIREVAVDLACTLVSVHTFWAGYLAGHRVDPAAVVQADARLPNERGHRIIARAILGGLSPFLNNRHDRSR